ncbi:MAG TPA: AAA family ATPase, partial [Gaiellaceae bacterium]|nr:AAA family ATPase [Gaiellaceae bacterium]
MSHNPRVVAQPGLGLVGRDHEIAALGAFGQGLRAGAAALVLRGEPGIGKTVVWREGVAAAQRDGARVLLARCAQAEMPIPLGALA